MFLQIKKVKIVGFRKKSSSLKFPNNNGKTASEAIEAEIDSVDQQTRRKSEITPGYLIIVPGCLRSKLNKFFGNFYLGIKDD